MKVPIATIFLHPRKMALRSSIILFPIIVVVVKNIV